MWLARYDFLLVLSSYNLLKVRRNNLEENEAHYWLSVGLFLLLDMAKNGQLCVESDVEFAHLLANNPASVCYV